MKERIRNLSQKIKLDPRWAFVLLLLLLVWDRFNGFDQFATVYADSDQTLLWQVAHDLLHGEWYQPCFYGQKYNPIVEPILALPFLYIGLDYWVAFPLVTILLTLFPIVLTATYLYKRVNPLSGMLTLLVFIALPVEYLMLTSMPRGFVAGLSAAVPGLLLLLFHQKARARFFGGFLLGLSLYLNPNAVILFPVLLLLLPAVIREFKQLTLPAALGFALGLIPLVWNNAFYAEHLELVIHSNQNMALGLDSFKSMFTKLDNYFNFVTPLLWRHGWPSLLLFIWAAIALLRRKSYLHFATVMALLAALLLSFSVAKIGDATNSAFFSGSRFYLAYPFILVYLFYVLVGMRYTLSKGLMLVLLVIGIGSFWYKANHFDSLLRYAMRGSAGTVVHVEPIASLKVMCQNLIGSAEQKPALLFGTKGHCGEQIWAYACPCLQDSLPPTYIPNYERRTWLNERYATMDSSLVLLLSIRKDELSRLLELGVEIVESDTLRNTALIDLNGQKIESLVSHFRIP